VPLDEIRELQQKNLPAPVRINPVTTAISRSHRRLEGDRIMLLPQELNFETALSQAQTGTARMLGCRLRRQRDSAQSRG